MEIINIYPVTTLKTQMSKKTCNESELSSVESHKTSRRATRHVLWEAARIYQTVNKKTLEWSMFR